MDVCLVNDKEAVPGEFLRQPADFPRPRTVAGGIVRRRHENETRVFVDMGVQLVKVEDEIGRQRLASDLNAVDETLNRIEREARLETDDIVPAGVVMMRMIMSMISSDPLPTAMRDSGRPR